MKVNTVILITLATLATGQNANANTERQTGVMVKEQLNARSFRLKDFLSDHMPWPGKKHWKDHEGKEHWNDKDGNDCWNDKDGKKHWKDHEGKEHWNKDDKDHFYKPPMAVKRSEIEI